MAHFRSAHQPAARPSFDDSDWDVHRIQFLFCAAFTGCLYLKAADTLWSTRKGYQHHSEGLTCIVVLKGQLTDACFPMRTSMKDNGFSAFLD